MLCYCSSLNTSLLPSLVVMSEEGPHIKSPFVLTPGGLVFCHSLSSIPDWWVRDRWRPLFCSLFFSIQSIGEPEESPALIVGEGELQQRAGCTASHSPKWSWVWLFAYKLTKKGSKVAETHIILIDSGSGIWETWYFSVFIKSLLKKKKNKTKKRRHKSKKKNAGGLALPFDFCLTIYSLVGVWIDCSVPGKYMFI